MCVLAYLNLKYNMYQTYVSNCSGNEIENALHLRRYKILKTRLLQHVAAINLCILLYFII